MAYQNPDRCPAAEALYWSRAGHVACGEHAPVETSTEWMRGQWQPIPAYAFQRTRYRCEQCYGRALALPSYERRLSSSAPTAIAADRG
jgi:hypothetical protein